MQVTLPMAAKEGFVLWRELLFALMEKGISASGPSDFLYQQKSPKTGPGMPRNPLAYLRCSVL